MSSNITILTNALCRCITGGTSNTAFASEAKWLMELAVKCKKTPMRQRYMKAVLPRVIGNWASYYCGSTKTRSERAYARIERVILA